MKRIILFLLLLSTSVVMFGQSTVDVINTTSTVLDSAGAWESGSYRSVIGYNSITITIKSDKNSATNGVKVYWADKVNNAYRIMDSVTTSYTTGTIFKLTLPVIAPYLKVKYTNTTIAQTTFSLVTMLHVGQQLKLADDGGLTISGATSNGALETTQLLVKKILQATRPSGKAYYSSLEGDFTATPITGVTGKVAITGLPFTLDVKDIVYASYRRQAGDWTYLGFEPTAGTGDTIVFSGTSFLSTDQVDLVIVNVPKTQDKANDAVKSIEQSPPWARYSPDQITTVAAGGDGASATTRTRTSMNGYRGVSFHKQITTADAGDSVRVTIWASNVADPSTANDNDWVPIHTAFTQYVDGVATANIGLQGVLFSGASTTKRVMWTLTDAPYNWIMVKRVTTDAGTANVVITNDAYRRF